jgi:hypothetical protein
MYILTFVLNKQTRSFLITFRENQNYFQAKQWMQTLSSGVGNSEGK